MGDLIEREAAQQMIRDYDVSNDRNPVMGERIKADLVARLFFLPAVQPQVGVKPLEDCPSCDGHGHTIGDDGDPRICPECHGDTVAPAALIAIAPDLAAEVIRLRDFLTELAEAKPGIIRGWRRDPQDDVPDMIEADYFDAWQDDARAMLAKIGGA